MKSPFRLIGRIAFLLLVLVLLAVGGVLAWFTSWRADRIAELSEGSEIVETALGPVEVSVRGDGPAVLVLHDALGGYDQARVFAEGLEEAGFRVIAPSRPGYLRTPLKSGLLPQQQGDLMIALLDALKVDKASVLAVGSGGPAAIEMALRFPSRLSGLVLLSTVVYRNNSVTFAPGSTNAAVLIMHGLTGDVGSWLALDFAETRPSRVADALLSWTTLGSPYEQSQLASGLIADPARLEWFQSLMGTFAPLSPRETGARNDILNDRSLPAMALDKITVPTLIVHGELDRNVPIAEARKIATIIPGAKLLPVPAAGHFVYLSPSAGEARKAIADFFQTRLAP